MIVKSLCLLSTDFGMPPPNLLRPFHERFAHAIMLCRKTFALDPSLAIPHVHLGVKAMYLDDDWDTAGE